MNSTNVEKFGAGALSALGTKPKPKQPPKPGKKSGARTIPENQCMGCGSEKHGDESREAREKQVKETGAFLQRL